MQVSSPTAIASLAALIAAAVSPLVQSVNLDRDVQVIEDLSQPHPRDYVRVRQGTPFTVPTGRILVVTGMGFSTAGTGGTAYQTVSVDGVPALTEQVWFNANVNGVQFDPWITEVPVGLTVVEGATVSAESNRTDSVILGYLVDA